jgi:elongation factor 1-beta
MAQVIVTITIMPESPDTDLNHILQQVTKKVASFGGEVGRHEEEPIAFGLKALKVTFVMDESKGSTEALEQDIAHMPDVASAETTDVRRAVG